MTTVYAWAQRFDNVRDSFNQLKARPSDLLLADLHLPDGSGLE